MQLGDSATRFLSKMHMVVAAIYITTLAVADTQCASREGMDVAVTHYKRVNATDEGDCCDACSSDQRCKVAVLHAGHCNLKSSVKLVSSTSEYIAIFPRSTPWPSPIPPQHMPHGSNMPYKLLKNAALPDTMYPMTGLGLRGSGYKIGQTQECWYYPLCCVGKWCPAVNAPREWLRMGGWRLDTGYPFGDSGGSQTGNATCGGRAPAPPTLTSANFSEKLEQEQELGGHYCDPHGTAKGIAQSGVARESIFISIKIGSAGPMQEVDEGDRQGESMLYWLNITYADLTMMHEGDLGNSGHHPSAFCSYPTTPACRMRVWKSCLSWIDKGKTRACGVANWELEWLQQLKDANITLPAVVQQKFHLHQSLATPRIRAIKEFCDAHGILFNGYSPLGRADWTIFGPEEGGSPTLLEEPIVRQIAGRVGRSAAQVLLRWHVQQGIPTQPRSMNTSHMRENLDVFSWELSDDDMNRLGSMPQCTTVRGDPFMQGDPNAVGHVNMIGPTLHC